MADTNGPSRFTKRVKVAVFLILKRTFRNRHLDESFMRNDMQKCDYICAPPLMATNKLTDHESDILQYCMMKKHQLCLKPEEELRELRNHYKNRDEDSVTHLRKEAKLGSSMRLHRKIGTGNMDKMLDKMLDYRLGSARNYSESFS
ncbi:hypothetical protein T01_6719 [Trichinella spiralis]|uniref:Uncharacterized protein n=1 Tax=Trichinella spiralis TaxID=6334 RepID=A0A0V1B9M1_TRISP|nr:hypothetical protein T01_6719 [Trichinella spiralis]